MTDLDHYRRFFAEEVEAAAGIQDPRLVEAFATVPRERFLGPGPWKIATIQGMSLMPAPGTSVAYRITPDADPRHIQHNIVVAIDPDRSLNNGHPGSLAARLPITWEAAWATTPPSWGTSWAPPAT